MARTTVPCDKKASIEGISGRRIKKQPQKIKQTNKMEENKLAEAKKERQKQFKIAAEKLKKQNLNIPQMQKVRGIEFLQQLQQLNEKYYKKVKPVVLLQDFKIKKITSRGIRAANKWTKLMTRM